MTYTIKKFSAACAFALLLAGNSVFAEVEIPEVDDQGEGFETTDVTRKDVCEKNRTYGILTACNTLNVLGTANIQTANITNANITNATITNETIVNQTVENLTVADDLTVDGTTLLNTLSVTGATTLVGLLSLVTPNVLDYGYFESNSNGVLPQAAVYTAVTNAGSSAYSLPPASGPGVIVEQPGIYCILYSANIGSLGAATAASMELAVNTVTILATTVSFISTDSRVASGAAILDIATAPATLTIVSTSNLFPTSINAITATLNIVRLR